MSKTSTPISTVGLGPEGELRKPRITSYGEVLWDTFPDGALLGGSAANVAYHAAILGAEARLISRVGADPQGERAVSQLDVAGVLTEDISIDPVKPTGSVKVKLFAGEPSFTIAENVAWDWIDPSAEAVLRMSASDALCFSTLAQRTTLAQHKLKTLLEGLTSTSRPSEASPYQGRRPLCLLDLNLRAPHNHAPTVLEALALCDLVKMNEEEASWLRVQFGGRNLVDWLFNHFGIQFIALTRGARGASLFTREESLHVPGQPVSGGDAVGAGDAFVASLAFSLTSGATPKEALAHANSYASWVASQKGAMPPRPKGFSTDSS